MKTRLFRKGERRSGEKDLELQPQIGSIGGRQAYEDINLEPTIVPRTQKDPRSKALEPDHFSP